MFLVLIYFSVLTSEENSNRHLSLANEGQYLLVNTNSVKYLFDQMSDLKVNETCPGEVDFTTFFPLQTVNDAI